MDPLLLSVAPLHTPVRETVDCNGFLPIAEEAEVEESTTFTAQAHYAHICDILWNYYDIDPAVFLTNQTADSASVNLFFFLYFFLIVFNGSLVLGLQVV